MKPEERKGDPNKTVAMRRFLQRLLSPSDLGHAVTAEVRDEARVLLGLPRVETGKAESR